MARFDKLTLFILLSAIVGSAPHDALREWARSIERAREAKRAADYSRAEDSLRDALESAQALPLCALTRVDTLDHFRSLYETWGKNEEAVQMSRERLSSLDEMLVDVTLKVEGQLSSLASRLDMLGDHEEARGLWLRLRSQAKRMRAQKSSVEGEALLGLAKSFSMDGRLIDSADYYLQALEGGYELDLPMQVVSSEILADLLGKIGRSEEANIWRAHASQLRQRLEDRPFSD
jgi:tetratricopeptide (TPR) repeat protein